MSTPWNIGHITRKRAGLHPDKVAVVFENNPVTYDELNRGANRCAAFFMEKGLEKGDRVAVLLANCIEFLEAYFAAAKLGLVFVPLNWRMVPPEIEYQLTDCGARMLLFHDQFLDNINEIRQKTKVEEDKLLFVKSDNEGMPDCPDWAADYFEQTSGKPEAEPKTDYQVFLDDPLSIVYTSGTTGNPKGAVLSHEQTFFKNFQIAVYTGGTPDDVVVAQMPLFHSGGLFIVSTPALCGGMTMIMRKGFNPDEFAEDVQKHKATIVFALTTMWKLILATGKLDQIDVSSVRCVVGGGERTPPSLFEELAKRGLYMQQGFGQTENSAMMVVAREDIHKKMGSIGKPGFFTEVWIQGEDGEALPPGEIGEMVARGPTVMSGYWNMPEETARTIKDGVLHTGDLGYMDEDGYFYIVDRAKDMYRSGGENVYPAEIEKILAGHPKVQNVAIIGVPDDKWGETGMAFVLPNPGEEVTNEDIISFLEGKASRYKYPRHVKLVDELPMTSTMKIKKAELKEKYAKARAS